jgi:starch phosphorylase
MDAPSLLIPTRPAEHIDLPQPLRRLGDLAYNLWWTWHREARRLFSRVDQVLWSRYLNPVRLIQSSRTAHLEYLANDVDFLAQMHEVLDAFDADMQREGLAGRTVAYVSAEYGLHECLPIYSGGLGILSGDHLKAASDMALPLVGIGLFYRRGYFQQIIDADGYQQHHYPDLDGLRMPILRVRDKDGSTLRVPVELNGRTVFLRVWVAHVGRIPLLLLDSYSTKNAIEDQYITSMLYVRGRAMRLEQEILLGRGAVAVMEALDLDPGVFHMNEGHSAFLAIENLKRSGEPGLQTAIAACKSKHVFTTHTPVPAGNEVFSMDAVRPYLEDTARTLGAGVDELLELGSAVDRPGFNLTALALRLSAKANGVSDLHAQVSREMWPDFDIQGVTNGIHVATWLGPEIGKVLNASPDTHPQILADRAAELSDESIWAAHIAQKHRLMRFVQIRSVRQAARHGRSPTEMRRIQSLLEPSALTLGFARRFAPYKRADLLFENHDRLKELLTHPTRPVQLILAGKAHPADRPGQEVIRRIWELADSDELRGRILLLEDYDSGVARLMVRGVDVWLNTPEWPREASGTSGMKAVANGALHASVPDGWWAECASPELGFTVGDAVHPDRRRDARLLMEMLEQQVVPLYYDRGSDGLPRAWIARMRNSMTAFLCRFSSRRMLEDYVRTMYGEALQGTPTSL